MTWLVPRLFVLPRKFPSPAYCAAMVCVPCAREAEVTLAMLPLKVAGAPNTTPSARNWIVPVGVPLPGATAVTVAVKVTLEPVGDGLAEVATALAVLAGLIVCVSVPEELALNVESPL